MAKMPHIKLAVDYPSIICGDLFCYEAEDNSDIAFWFFRLYCINNLSEYHTLLQRVAWAAAQVCQCLLLALDSVCLCAKQEAC